jgi:hypothetical protein
LPKPTGGYCVRCSAGDHSRYAEDGPERIGWTHIAEVNGKRSFIGYVQGKPFSVVSINVTNGRIQNAFVVTNPEKLSRLPELKEG